MSTSLKRTAAWRNGSQSSRLVPHIGSTATRAGVCATNAMARASEAGSAGSTRTGTSRTPRAPDSKLAISVPSPPHSGRVPPLLLSNGWRSLSSRSQPISSPSPSLARRCATSGTV